MSVWEAAREYVLDVTAALAGMPFNVTEKFYWLYALTFVGLAYLSFRRYYATRSRGGFFRFLFPKRIYAHPSARVDYGIFLINVLISPMLLVGAGLQAWLSIEIATALVAVNDGQAVFTGDWSMATYAVFIVGYTLAADLSVYVIHRFHHRSDVFWPFHALHHSAEVLTPVTLFRKHPVWNVLANLVNLAFTGAFQGVFVFVFFGNPGFELLFGLNTVYVLYNFCGANLRHSHVWLSWGKALSHVFISPAMHQIHHDPTRMNKNYGEVFAIWDWMFGSLYVPQGYEAFEIGLGDGVANPHGTLGKAYLVPVADAWAALKRRFTN